VFPKLKLWTPKYIKIHGSVLIGQRGTAFGPQAVRTGEITIPWGMETAHPTVGDVDFLKVLNVVDYGDAPIDILSNERSILSVHKMVKEIAETGTIPVIVGGITLLCIQM
jgi:agmatinase